MLKGINLSLILDLKQQRKLNLSENCVFTKQITFAILSERPCIWEPFSGKECQRGSLWNLVAKSCDRHEYRAHSSFASAWVIFHSTQNHRIIVCNRADATVAKDCTICSEPCMPHQSPLEIAEERKNPEILRILAEYITVNREL